MKTLLFTCCYQRGYQESEAQANLATNLSVIVSFFLHIDLHKFSSLFSHSLLINIHEFYAMSRKKLLSFFFSLPS